MRQEVEKTTVSLKIHPFSLKNVFKRFIMYMGVWPAYTSMHHMWTDLDAKEVVEALGTEVTGGCEPDVGAGNWIWVLWKIIQCS